MIVEALFVVDPDMKYDIGTIVALKPVGKFYANRAEYDADVSRERLLENSKRSEEELAKDELRGIDTRWGREERRQFGLILLDIPSQAFQNFITCKHKFDFSQVSQNRKDKWRDRNHYYLLDRQETPISLTASNFIKTQWYIDNIESQEQEEE